MGQNEFFKFNIFSICVLLCLVSALTCQARKVSKIELKPTEYQSIIKSKTEDYDNEEPSEYMDATPVPINLEKVTLEEQLLPSTQIPEDIVVTERTIIQDTYDTVEETDTIETTEPSLLEQTGPEPTENDEEQFELPSPTFDSNGNPVPINYITPITINSPYPYVQTHVHIPGPDNALYNYIQNKRPVRNSHRQYNHRPYVTHEYHREPIDWNHIQSIVQGARGFDTRNNYGRYLTYTIEPEYSNRYSGSNIINRVRTQQQQSASANRVIGQTVSAADLDEIVIDNRQPSNEVIFLSNNVETIQESNLQQPKDVVIQNVVSVEEIEEPEIVVPINTKENVNQILNSIELTHPRHSEYIIGVQSESGITEVDDYHLNDNIVKVNIHGQVNHHVKDSLHSNEKKIQNFDRVAIIKTNPENGLSGELNVDISGNARSNEYSGVSREHGRVNIHVHGDLKQNGGDQRILVDEQKYFNINQHNNEQNTVERDHIRVNAQANDGDHERIYVNKNTRTKINDENERITSHEYVKHNIDNQQEHLNSHAYRNVHVNSNEHQQNVKVNENEKLNYRDKLFNEKVHSNVGSHLNYNVNQHNGNEHYNIHDYENLYVRDNNEKIHLHNSNILKGSGDRIYSSEHSQIDQRTQNENIHLNDFVAIKQDRDQEDVRYYNHGHIHNRLNSNQYGNQQVRVRDELNIGGIETNENQRVRVSQESNILVQDQQQVSKPIRLISSVPQRQYSTYKPTNLHFVEERFGYRNVQPRLRNQQIRNQNTRVYLNENNRQTTRNNGQNQQNILVSSEVSQNVQGNAQVVNQQADSNIFYTSNEKNYGSGSVNNQQNILVSSDVSQNVQGAGKIINQQADSNILYTSNENNNQRGILSGKQNQENILVSSDVYQNVQGNGQLVKQQDASNILYTSNRNVNGLSAQKNIIVNSDAIQNVQGNNQIIKQQADSNILYTSSQNGGELSTQQNQQNILLSSEVSQNVQDSQIVNQRADSDILYTDNVNNGRGSLSTQNQQNIIVASDVLQNVQRNDQVVNQQSNSDILYTSSVNNYGRQLPAQQNQQNILVSSDVSQNVQGNRQIVNQQADSNILYTSNTNSYERGLPVQQNQQNVLVSSDVSQNVQGNRQIVNQQADSSILYTSNANNYERGLPVQQNQQNVLVSSDISQSVQGNRQIVNQEADSNILYTSIDNSYERGLPVQQNQQNVLVSSDVSQSAQGNRQIVNQQADSNILYTSNVNNYERRLPGQQNVRVSSGVLQNVQGQVVNQQADSDILYTSNVNNYGRGLTAQQNQQKILVSSDASQNVQGNGQIVNQQADSDILYTSNINNYGQGLYGQQNQQKSIVTSDVSQNVQRNDRVVNQQATSNTFYTNSQNRYDGIVPVRSQQNAYESSQILQNVRSSSQNNKNIVYGGRQQVINQNRQTYSNEPLIEKRNSDEQNTYSSIIVQDRINNNDNVRSFENVYLVNSAGNQQQNSHIIQNNRIFQENFANKKNIIIEDIINSNEIADELLDINTNGIGSSLNQETSGNPQVIYVYDAQNNQNNNLNNRIYVNSQSTSQSNNANQRVIENINSNINVLERQNQNGGSSERINVDNQASLRYRDGNQRVNENIISNVNVLERQNQNGASNERINVDNQASLRYRDGNQRVNENINSNVNVLERQNQNGASSERINVDNQASLRYRDGNQRVNENINSNVNVLERQNQNGASSERINVDNQASLRYQDDNQQVKEKINSKINVVEKQNTNGISSERINVDNQASVRYNDGNQRVNQQIDSHISSTERVNNRGQAASSNINLDNIEYISSNGGIRQQNNQPTTLLDGNLQLTNEDIESSIAYDDVKLNQQQIISNENNRVDSQIIVNQQIVSNEQQVNPEYIVLSPVPEIDCEQPIDNLQATITYNEGGRRITEQINEQNNGVQHIRITSVEQDDDGDLITHRLDADVRTVIQSDSENQQQAVTFVENLDFENDDCENQQNSEIISNVDLLEVENPIIVSSVVSSIERNNVNLNQQNYLLNDRNQILIRTNNELNNVQLKPVNIGCDSVEIISNVPFTPVEERKIQSFLGDCGSAADSPRVSSLPPLHSNDVNEIINNLFYAEQKACECTRQKQSQNQQSQLTYYVDDGQYLTQRPKLVQQPQFVTLTSGSVNQLYDGTTQNNVVAISEVIPRSDLIIESTPSVDADIYLGDTEIGPAAALDLETLSFKKPSINKPTPQSQIVQISPENLERLGYDKYVPETEVKKQPIINVIDNDKEHQRRVKSQRSHRYQNRGFLPFRNGHIHGIGGQVNRQTETVSLLNNEQFKDIVSKVNPNNPVTVQKIQPCANKEVLINDNIQAINGFSV